jgi:hypothetical protein
MPWLFNTFYCEGIKEKKEMKIFISLCTVTETNPDKVSHFIDADTT